MCREKEEAAEARKIGQYVLFEYCLTRNCRSGRMVKWGEIKQGLSWFPQIIPLHIQQRTVGSFFFFFFDWLCKKQTKKKQQLLLQISSERKSEAILYSPV